MWNSRIADKPSTEKNYYGKHFLNRVRVDPRDPKRKQVLHATKGWRRLPK